MTFPRVDGQEDVDKKQAKEELEQGVEQVGCLTKIASVIDVTIMSVVENSYRCQT